MVLHVFISLLGWGSIVHSLWFVQWDFTRRDHPRNPGGVSGSGLVMHTEGLIPLMSSIHHVKAPIFLFNTCTSSFSISSFEATEIITGLVLYSPKKIHSEDV